MAEASPNHPDELLDVLTKSGEKTGVAKPRGLVHRDGDYHRAAHVWIYAETTQELLLQRRADCKDSWPGLWDISSAGHVTAGDTSLVTARRELDEELGISLPADAFELIFLFLQECVINDGKYINNEYNDVYLVTTLDPIPLEAFTLQETEVSSVRYISWKEYKSCLASEDKEYVPYDVNGQYGQLFHTIEQRYKDSLEDRSLALQKQLNRYAPVSFDAELNVLSEGDRRALKFMLEASRVLDDIFYSQVWYTNSTLRDWLKEHSDASHLDKLKWMYYSINKSPWSALDEGQAFLTTADSAVKLVESTKPIFGWKGIKYRVAFPLVQPPGASFYPPDMDKQEFELWKSSLRDSEQEAATGFFTVIRRGEKSDLSSTSIGKMSDVVDTNGKNQHVNSSDLCIVPYSQEYRHFLEKAAELLFKAATLTDSPSLKKLLQAKADSFLSNDYYASDIAWMELNSKLDITIGPYETYEDKVFGYKELQEFHSALEEAKADIVGLWALRFLIYQEVLPESLLKSMYVSFLAGCFRSIRFGLEEAHGKGQALIFNWLYEKKAFFLHSDGTFSVDFLMVEGAVESLCREILTTQAKGDKASAKSLFERDVKVSQPLRNALEKLERIQVPVDIIPTFEVVKEILEDIV